MKSNRHTILLKGCPRCRGDLFYEPWERQRLCLQCGHRLSREQERELLASVRRERLKGHDQHMPPVMRPGRPPVGVTTLL